MYTLVYPMAALVFLKFLILSVMLMLRVQAVRNRKISPGYFKLNIGGKEPEVLRAVSQCFNNLLELPILFYIVCLIAIVLNKSSDYLIVLAWLYVFLRYIHAFILSTYNHILHRLFVFAVSCVVLIAMWVKVVVLVSTMV